MNWPRYARSWTSTCSSWTTSSPRRSSATSKRRDRAACDRPHGADPRHLRPARPHAVRAACRSSWRNSIPPAAPHRAVERPLALGGGSRGSGGGGVGGAIGVRGPGETQAGDRPPPHPPRISEAAGASWRTCASSARCNAASARREAIPPVALVGYTNAGKSTLFNALTAARGATPRTSSSPRSTRRRGM